MPHQWNSSDKRRMGRFRLRTARFALISEKNRICRKIVNKFYSNRIEPNALKLHLNSHISDNSQYLKLIDKPIVIGFIIVGTFIIHNQSGWIN